MKESGVYKQLVNLPYLVAYKKAIEGSVSLDVFSKLTEWKSAETVAIEGNWDKDNTENLLEALFSIGFLERKGDKFRNTEEADKYLVKDSPYYMGNVVLFFGTNKGMDPGDVAKQVKEGSAIPEQKQQMEQAIDFAAYGGMMREAQSGIRIQEILELVRTLPENDSFKNMLDLGCGAGMIGLELLKDGSNRRMAFFDVPQMKPLIDESIARAGEENRTRVMAGDFMKGSIGEGYDMILASSVMSFALGDLHGFMKKLYDALNTGGVVLCINEGIAPDASGPWEMIMGYLPMKLQGIPVGVSKGLVGKAAEAVGFTVENRTLLLSTGTHDINILRK